MTIDFEERGELRVVIADDHASFRSGLRSLLAQVDGLVVVGEAATGDEAVGRVAALHPDVVLMDLAMPGLDGIEATRRLKVRWPDLPVVILTVHDDPVYERTARAAGADRFLLKKTAGTVLWRALAEGTTRERLADELTAGRGVLEAAGVTLLAEVEPFTLPADTERVLALALREAVTNVVRHARASRCIVRLATLGDTVRLSVEDNGVGGELAEGAGLAGMRERLAEIGGSLERDGINGTRLRLSVPVSSALTGLPQFLKSGEVA